jgi:hypothetical protein
MSPEQEETVICLKVKFLHLPGDTKKTLVGSRADV